MIDKKYLFITLLMFNIILLGVINYINNKITDITDNTNQNDKFRNLIVLLSLNWVVTVLICVVGFSIFLESGKIGFSIVTISSLTNLIFSVLLTDYITRTNSLSDIDSINKNKDDINKLTIGGLVIMIFIFIIALIYVVKKSRVFNPEDIIVDYPPYIPPIDDGYDDYNLSMYNDEMNRIAEMKPAVKRMSDREKKLLKSLSTYEALGDL